MSKIMISYNRKSEAIIRILVKHLEEQGHTVWFDQDLSGGQVWWDQILAEVRECDIFVFALSPEALKSTACKREYKYADDLRKPILPILVTGGVSIKLLPPALSQIQYVDYRKQDIGTANRLARALSSIPSPMPLPDPLPNPPQIPTSYLGSLAEKVRTTSEQLSFAEQSSLVFELKRALRNLETADDTHKLLVELRKRRDLFATIAEEIDELLKDDSTRRAKEELQQKEEEEARLKAEKKAKRKAAEEEAHQKEEEEARLKAEKEARRKAAKKKASRKAEEEAHQKDEWEARAKAQKEAKRKLAEQKRIEEEQTFPPSQFKKSETRIRINGFKIMLAPRRELEIIAKNEISISHTLLGYVIPLALIPTIAIIVGYGLIGIYGFSSLNYGIALGLVQLLNAILSVFIAAFVINALAPSFGSQKNMGRAVQLVAYSMTPAWVGGIFNLYPEIAWLGSLFGLYGLYLFIVGVYPLMKTPDDKAVGYIIVSIIILIVVYFVIAVILTVILLSVFGLSMWGAANLYR